MAKELDPNEILSREFEYAAQTAIQANEDRVRVFNYYLATVGTLFAASVFANLDDSAYVELFSFVIGGLAVLGFIFLLKLIKLRVAWRDSVCAMCQIKKYYIVHCDNQLEDAFRWKSESIPSVSKVYTIAFLMGLIIIILSSASAAGAVYFWGKATERVLTSWSIGVGVVSFGMQLIAWMVATRLNDQESKSKKNKIPAAKSDKKNKKN
jgi:hypothetical protein